MDNTAKGGISPYNGSFFFTPCFCYGRLEDGTYGAFDSLDDYEKYREELKEKEEALTKETN